MSVVPFPLVVPHSSHCDGRPHVEPCYRREAELEIKVVLALSRLHPDMKIRVQERWEGFGIPDIVGVTELADGWHVSIFEVKRTPIDRAAMVQANRYRQFVAGLALLEPDQHMTYTVNVVGFSERPSRPSHPEIGFLPVVIR